MRCQTCLFQWVILPSPPQMTVSFAQTAFATVFGTVSLHIGEASLVGFTAGMAKGWK